MRARVSSLDRPTHNAALFLFCVVISLTLLSCGGTVGGNASTAGSQASTSATNGTGGNTGGNSGTGSSGAAGSGSGGGGNGSSGGSSGGGGTAIPQLGFKPSPRQRLSGKALHMVSPLA